MEAGLGISETDTWYMIETIAGKNNIGYKHIVSYTVCTYRWSYFVYCVWLRLKVFMVFHHALDTLCCPETISPGQLKNL